MKRRISKKLHARYDIEERMFVCLICEETGFDERIYYPWEIPIHLKKDHKINRKQQNIDNWNEKFESEYQKNRNRPLIMKDESIFVDTTSQEKYEEERKRRLLEAKARREA